MDNLEDTCYELLDAWQDYQDAVGAARSKPAILADAITALQDQIQQGDPAFFDKMRQAKVTAPALFRDADPVKRLADFLLDELGEDDARAMAPIGECKVGSKVTVTGGEHKGKKGKVTRMSGDRLLIRDTDGEELRVRHGQVRESSSPSIFGSLLERL